MLFDFSTSHSFVAFGIISKLKLVHFLRSPVIAITVLTGNFVWCGKLFGEYSKHLRTALEVLRKNELYAKLNKFKFWLEKVAFLGHMMSKKGVSIDPQNIETMIKWHAPEIAIKV